MLEKEPSVLLCAGRIRLSSPNYELKGDAFKLESINVGQKFGHTPNKPVEAKIHREGKRGLVTIRRVNGFHPSYAINYHPHVSRLRQLQILIGAETCGMLREDWKEEKWMDELRSSCQDDSQAPSGKSIYLLPPSQTLLLTFSQLELSTQSPQSQSSCQGSTRPKNPRYLLDYQDLYFRNLVSILRCVRSLVSETRPEVNLFTALYTPLLTCGLSELCNDANLILRQMSRLQTKGWLKPMENAALKQAAIDTLTFTDELQKVAKNSRNAQFVQIFQKGASFLRESTKKWSGRRLKNQLELNSASDAFLNIATNIETLLMELLLEEENNLNALGQEDTLSRGMERMKLEPVLTSAVLPFHA
jgi:hypothetical protein